jgi:uncharacterized protein YdaU (DUF1376 family)
MSAPPYMKLYVADYLGDTHHLSTAEHGAYMLLLMAMWRAGGALPAADANLAKLAKCQPDQWAEIRDVILPFFQRSRGKLTHKRVALEMAKYENTSGKRSEAGKRGGRQKANDNNGPTKAIAKQTESNCRHNQNQNQIDTEAKASGGEPPQSDPNAKAWAEAKALLFTQGGMTIDAAGKFFGKLLAQHRLEARDLLGAINEALANSTSDPQGWLTKAAQARNRNRAPQPEKRVSWV